MITQDIFEINATKISELHQAVLNTLKYRDKGPEYKRKWQEAAKQFQDNYDSLAFPGGLTYQEELLRQNDSEAIEGAIKFLEADPWFYRSGYIKEKFSRLLKRVSLTHEQSVRLRKVLLAKVDTETGREFRSYCRLARVIETQAFRQELEERLQSLDEGVVLRAKWMLAALK
jgi:hypothetical protein